MEEKRLETGLYAWKEICEFHGWNTISGNYRKAREKDLSTMYSWEKESRKIRIKEVYKENVEKLDSGLFRGDIELLLLHTLSKANGREVSLTMNNLLKALDIVNKNYVFNCYSIDKISDSTKAEKEIVNDVINIINRKKALVLGALKSLERKGIIMYNVTTRAYYKKAVYAYDEYGNIETDINGDSIILRYDDATKELSESEIELYLKVQKEIMKELNINDLACLYINDEKRKNFYRKLNSGLSKYNIGYTFKTYDIIYLTSSVNRALKRSEEAKVRNRLNSNVLDSVLNTIRNYANKAEIGEEIKELIECGLFKEEEISFINGNIDNVRASKGYEKKATKVAKVLIDRKIKTRDLII